MNIHGEHGPSVPQKLFLAANHLAAVALVAWFLIGGGFNALSAWLDLELDAADNLRKALLLSASAVYFGRVCVTGYFLQRKMGWGEAVTVAIWLYVLHFGIALLGGTNPDPLGFAGVAGCALYLTGSYLNTASEYERYRWKQKPENQGRLYTEGLFRYSMHINYFGDTVLFTGFALITGSIWALAIPGAMAASFIFFHIPTLDVYLRGKYGKAFETYAESTSKFVPRIFPSRNR